jgi:hypothetical protein
MADRVSASIVLGGTLDIAAFAELAQIISNEGLSLEWDGEPFEPQHRTIGQSLGLYAHEVSWGRFSELEDWCITCQLPFVRWSGGYAGQWGPERVVATGDGTLTSYAVTESDEVVIGRAAIVKLGSFEAVLAHFDAAEFIVPPLIVEGDVLEPGAGLSTPDGASHVE